MCCFCTGAPLLCNGVPEWRWLDVPHPRQRSLRSQQSHVSTLGCYVKNYVEYSKCYFPQLRANLTSQRHNKIMFNGCFAHSNLQVLWCWDNCGTAVPPLKRNYLQVGPLSYYVLVSTVFIYNLLLLRSRLELNLFLDFTLQHFKQNIL